MQYLNINNHNIRVSFREAVLRSISPDMGLFMPEQIPEMGAAFFERLPAMDLTEIAFEAGTKYTDGEIPPSVLLKICERAFNFPVVLRQISSKKQVLELFHGPTAAFKDFGARFMSQCLRYFSETEDRTTVVLVATSGDTGGAIADSFFGIEGIDVIILYPSGKVSRLQENQLTTLGHNITALEVDGTFDDCQAMVKNAFTRLQTGGKIRLTSANSINIARLIPQSFYYYYALSRTGADRVIAVPSGNFGNLTGAVLAWKTGLQVEQFIAATNINKAVPDYLMTGVFTPAETIPTIANAMDVGNPGNFHRLLHIFNNNYRSFKAMVAGYWFDDDMIREHIREDYLRTGYIFDPHGAVASLGLDRYLDEHPGTAGIFVATAHPAKFNNIIEPVIGKTPEMPDSLKRFMSGEKQSVKIKSGYHFLEEYLLDRYRL
jgi:threonine synthase